MKDLSEPFAGHKREIGAPDDLEVDLDFSSETEAQGAHVGNPSVVRLSSKKKEALSQVPCKFFRSNGCSAGAACPFAHIMPGEGQGKAICQWFLKGSCRFGHKCALAHILPGQPISMDRKNKRAAHQQQQQQQQQQMLQPAGHIAPFVGQAAAQGTPPMHADQYPSHQSMPFPLQTGTISDVRDRVASSSRLEIQNPGAQYHHREPDLLFGLPDDLQMPISAQQRNGNVAPAQQLAGMVSSPPDWQSNFTRMPKLDGDLTRVRHFDNAFESSAERTASSRTGPMTTEAFGTSPFSNPGSQSVFYSNRAPSGRIDSMGKPDTGQTGREIETSAWDRGGNLAVHDRDEINEEDFLPSSLSDLLTPAELQRRSNGGMRSNTLKHNLIPQSMPASSTLRDNSFFQTDKRAETNLYPPGNMGADLPTEGNTYASSQLGANDSSAGFLASTLIRGSTNRTEDGMEGSQGNGPGDAFSKSTEAAVLHAPGQSLPPGLAAGLSRLHLQRNDEKGDDREHRRADIQPPSTSNRSIWNQTQKGGSGGESFTGSARSIEELGPIAPSSIFAHKTPMHLAMSRSTAGPIGSGPNSLEAQHQYHQQHHQVASGSNSNANTYLSTSVNGSIGSATVFSPYARSPVVHNEGGIAIPSSTGSGVPLAASKEPSYSSSTTQPSTGPLARRSGSSSSNNNKSSTAAASHPGMQRIRTTGHTNAVASSPLAVPITGEEVEEPMFELE